MATKTDPDQDKYNPGARQYNELTGGDQRPGSTDMSDFENRGVMSQSDIDSSRQGFYKPGDKADDSKKNAGQAEKQAIGDSAVGKAATTAASTVNVALGQAAKILGKIKTKKGGAAAFFISLILVAIVGIAAFYSLSLAPVAFFTNTLDDLNDSVAALDDAKIRLMRTKVPFNDTDNLMKGCQSKMSIRCKYRSLSVDKDVAQLRKAGIEVDGRVIGGRMFPNRYKIGDKNYNSRQMANAIRNDPDVGAKFRTSFNMRTLSTLSPNFKAVLAKFHTSAKAASTTGDTAEERYKNLAETGKKSPVPLDAKFVDSGEVDENGNKLWQIEGQQPPPYFTEAEKLKAEAISKQVGDFGKPGFKSKFMKSISLTGWLDMACTFKNMIGLSAQVGKVYQKRHLIQAAMPLAALAFKMKMGEATEQDAEAIGEYFTRTDNRTTVDDVPGSVTENEEYFGAGGVDRPGDIPVRQKPNSFNGKNAMDGNLAQLSTHGGPFKHSEASVRYSLSMTDSMLVTGLAGTAASLQTITSVGGGGDKCDIIQSWWMRGAGLIGGIFAAWGSAGTSVAFNIAAMATMAIGMMVVQEKLMSMVSGSPVPDDIEKKPEDRQAIQWTGIAALSDEVAMRNGLVPGTPDDILAYQQRSLPTKQQYIALEANQVAWNDLSSPYSLLGQLVTQRQRFTPQSLTIPDTIASVRNLLAAASNQAINPSAYATTIDRDRLNHCDDDIYKKAGPDGSGIAVDVQCNVRYHIPPEDAAMEADEVAEYMETNNYVAKDTDTGMPDGYQPPSEGDASSFIDDIVSGIVNDFYNTRSSMYRANGSLNQYAIYLDYCVYRVMPWGETYEESGAFRAVSNGWKDGSNCMLRDGQQGDGINGSVVKYFRTYVVTNSALGIRDDYTASASYTPNPGGVSDGQPPDTVSFGALGWGLRDNTDYYEANPCEGGMPETGKYTHPTRGFTIRLCESPGGDDVNSLISGRLAALLAKAQADGINMTVYSGFRTYEEQAALYRQKCSSGTCEPPTAQPGTVGSNHEEGLAGDFALDGSRICWGRATCRPEENKVYDLLVKEAGNYGFLKHPREAWHWGMRTYN